MFSISPTPREIASQRSTAMADGPGAIDITEAASTMREYPGAPTLRPRRGDDPGLSTFRGLRSKTRSRGARKLGKGEPHRPTSGDGSGARGTSGQRIELLLPEQLSSLGRQHANLKGDPSGGDQSMAPTGLRFPCKNACQPCASPSLPLAARASGCRPDLIAGEW